MTIEELNSDQPVSTKRFLQLPGDQHRQVTLTDISLSDNNDNDDLVCPSRAWQLGALARWSARRRYNFSQAELDAGGRWITSLTASFERSVSDASPTICRSFVRQNACADGREDVRFVTWIVSART